ncbi:MAG: carboxypeptidase-like regulatory domain-containing protein [Bacteroidota bacterium]
MPGVNIVIKGTDVGTVTDADGRYSISVPIGSVLVFSFIGMQTREILVTETSLQGVSGKTPVRIRSQKGNWNPSILADTIKTDTEGVTTLRHNTPSYGCGRNVSIPATSFQSAVRCGRDFREIQKHMSWKPTAIVICRQRLAFN